MSELELSVHMDPLASTAQTPSSNSLPAASTSMGMRRPRTLFDCPAEIVESIILDIDGPQDLLQLALACKVLSKRIIPHHIQFQILKIGLADILAGLWSALLQHKSLVSRYRTVEIYGSIGPESPVLPHCLLPLATELAPSQADFVYIEGKIILDLGPLISHMANLTTLKTFTTPSELLPFLRLLSRSTPCLVSLDLSLPLLLPIFFVKQLHSAMVRP
ncbi:hypothetical protein M422DRAFT_262325 [Sphaerobolus stellatus SS14]|uniref:F-box domain-containing protein n=1 Tax=Sphaerobolus stellatus (strain SS14) TaxID=990650 RepID=A0A0C9VCX1_SPHS4|nr:hypothetical protein M422DRAFT_262325 [Sphaerobolus stellatus SS14]